jgi:hypothetical protein
MDMNTRVLPVAAALLLLAAGKVHPSLLPPLTAGRVFASPSGHQGFKVSLKDMGTLFRIDAEGSEVVVWQAKLLNHPGKVLFRDEGPEVVTVDDIDGIGRQHALVVYGKGGRVLGDYALEDLLTAGEIRDRVAKLSPSRRWTRKAEFSLTRDRFIARLKWAQFDFDPDSPTFTEILDLPGGKLIEIDLKSGRLLKSAAFDGSGTLLP